MSGVMVLATSQVAPRRARAIVKLSASQPPSTDQRSFCQASKVPRVSRSPWART